MKRRASRVIGISGSPNKNGSNEKAVNYALKIAKQNGFDTEKIFLSGLDIKPCMACKRCKKLKKCVIEDDFNHIIPLLADADGIIISSPVYMGCLSGQLKCLFDRTVFLRRKDFMLKNKVGGAVAIGGSRNGGQELTIQNIHAWMHIHGIIVVGDDNHFGGIVKAPFDKDEEGVKTVKATAEKLCQVISLVKK